MSPLLRNGADMFCEKFSSDRCHSCQWLALPYPQQLERKQAQLETLFANSGADFFPPVVSAETGFRNKAKMVVLGTVDHPVLGIVNRHGVATDLSDCPLYPAVFQPLFVAIKGFIKQARLTPYNVSKKRGELKFVLLQYSQAENAFMLRFVLRSTEQIERIRQHLPELLAAHSALKVISVNLQPVHMAVLEGDEEVLLTETGALTEALNDVPLRIRPGGFFQTNTSIASKLYRTAAEWVSESSAKTLVDLFCGAGGFGLHCLRSGQRLLGLEISPESIAAAQSSAEQMGHGERVRFQVMDLQQGLPTLPADFAHPDQVLVNPPRRGLGLAVCDWLRQVAPNQILYSSCNAESMAEDIGCLPGYRLRRLQLFDMFPHTAHYEVLGLLQREPA